MTSVKVTPVPVEKLLEHWPAASVYIESAIEHGGEHTIEQLIDGLQEERYLLWVVRRTDDGSTIGALITSVISRKIGIALHISYLGGDSIEAWWPALDEAMINAARLSGCKWITEQGRRGWLRKLPRAGFEELFTVMGKRVSE